MGKRAGAPDDLYGPLLGCFWSTLRQWLKVIAPALFLLSALWFLAFGLWTLAAVSLITFVYYMITLRTEQTRREQERRWIDRFSEAWTNPRGLSLRVAGGILLLIAIDYGFTIGFWVGTGVLAVLLVAWIVRRIGRPGSDGR